MKLIALYKAFSGGEWVEASLRSIVDYTDGAVVAMSQRPWLAGLGTQNDCWAPLAHFRATHPNYPMKVIEGSWDRQEDQYRDAVQAAMDTFGVDIKLLIVDTDEIHTAAGMQKVRQFLSSESTHLALHSYVADTIFSYLRSPLYRVWPTEPNGVLIGVSSPAIPEIKSRFRGFMAQKISAAVHHMCYIRSNPGSIMPKLLNTSSQEWTPSDPSWVDTVWDNLPYGNNLHMTLGAERCWPEIKILTPDFVPEEVKWADVYAQTVLAEEARWRERVRHQTPEQAVYPTPNKHDWEKYQSEVGLFKDPEELYTRLKCTILEALWLTYFSKQIPPLGKIVEIGSGCGGSLVCLGVRSYGELVAIDPFEPYDEQNYAGIARGVKEGNEDGFWETCEVFDLTSRVTQVKARSLTEKALKAAEGADLIFIDGNHSKDIVEQELPLYWDRLKVGGYLLMHDYTVRFPGVMEAVDEWQFGDNVRIAAGTSLAYIQKV